MTWSQLEKRVTGCNSCPRLRLYCQGIAAKGKKEFKGFSYWGKPVPGFGDPQAKLWIIGLAPAAHGANRTGRMFTGDSSGNWLYQALYDSNLANQPLSLHQKDGLKLKNCFISAAVRCAPPENRPTPKELTACSQYLDSEFQLLKNKQLVLALGKIAFDATLKLLERNQIKLPTPKPKFTHGAKFKFDNITLIASYHPSRQNTNTRLLTKPMWNHIFKTILNELSED